MKQEIAEAISSHPVSTGVATTILGLPVVDLLDLASNLTTLIAGCMGIAVSYFFIQYHRSNIKINDLKIAQMQKEANDE